ncbi:hypothetical protein ACSLVK_15925 [Photorhabdus tasmaniensis]|uniref:Tc toxin subunit A-related protein n=1 Tax=Photorhabdus tasmaniensis TaxID=1004159 RepID=UPI00404140C1
MSHKEKEWTLQRDIANNEITQLDGWPSLRTLYQIYDATLTMDAEIATLLHGMNDDGRFVTNFNDSRFLPFEDREVTTGTLTLNLFHAGKQGSQHDPVANLSDIIVHLNYIIRDA